MTILSELALAIGNDIRLNEEEKTKWVDQSKTMDEELQKILLEALRAESEEELEVQKRRITQYKNQLRKDTQKKSQEFVHEVYVEEELFKKSYEEQKLQKLEAFLEELPDTR